MRILLVVAAGLAFAAIWVLGPLLAAIAGLLGLLGAVLHEVLHYIAAVAVGADNVTFGWDATGPYVAYDGRMQAIVQLAPPLTAITLAAFLTATSSFPNASIESALAGSFLLGLHSLSPTDYTPLRRVFTTSV